MFMDPSSPFCALTWALPLPTHIAHKHTKYFIVSVLWQSPGLELTLNYQVGSWMEHRQWHQLTIWKWNSGPLWGVSMTCLCLLPWLAGSRHVLGTPTLRQGAEPIIPSPISVNGPGILCSEASWTHNIYLPFPQWLRQGNNTAAHKYYISKTSFCSFELNFKSKFSLFFLHFSLITIKAKSISTWPHACGISTLAVVEAPFVS